MKHLLILHLLALISTCLVACNSDSSSSLLDEFPAWKDGRPSEVRQSWIKDGKEYDVHVFNYGDTTIVYRNYDDRLYAERYIGGELMDVVEY